MGRANMSSLLLFLPTLLPSTHTQSTMNLSPAFPLSPTSSNENRHELGFGLDEVVTGFIQMHSRLQPGVRVKKYECQNIASFFFFHSLFPHICPNVLPALILLLSFLLLASSRKHNNPDLNFAISLSMEQHFLALKYYNNKITKTAE